MVKNYILDTNVLLHDPHSLESFEDNRVIIPLPVVEELDQFKRNSGQIGANCRQVIRRLDEMIAQEQIQVGLPIRNHHQIIIQVFETFSFKVSSFISQNRNDNIILSYVHEIQKTDPGTPAILVTKDIHLRVKANALGVQSQDFLSDKASSLEQDHGYLSLSIPDKQKETLFSKGSLELVALDEEKDRLIPNLFLDLGEDQLAKVSPSGDCIIALRPRNPSETWGISARNREQHFAIEALMDPQIPLVTLYGPAGTGKTLLAVAIGLVHVLDERKFKKMTVTKPVIPMGKDIGYLPGSMDEKIRPWVQPIYDNLEFLFGNKGINAEEYLAKRHLLEVQVLSHIRGRSIPEQYLIIDEAQNLTPHEIKTILTRVGEKTKIILTGDPHQIDHPYLDTMSNGLMYAKSKFYGDSLAAHIHLVHGERSALSSRAAQLL